MRTGDGEALPQELLLAGSVVGAQSLELRLPLVELGQDLVLRVAPRTRTLLRVQQTLGHQLLLDPGLQGARVGNTGEGSS